MKTEFDNTENEALDKADADSNGKCSRCDYNVAQQEHTCPYAEEIHGDSSSLCDCCSDCESQCCMDI
jgi:hypothetical protein